MEALKYPKIPKTSSIEFHPLLFAPTAKHLCFFMCESTPLLYFYFFAGVKTTMAIVWRHPRSPSPCLSQFMWGPLCMSRGCHFCLTLNCLIKISAAAADTILFRHGAVLPSLVVRPCPFVDSRFFHSCFSPPMTLCIVKLLANAISMDGMEIDWPPSFLWNSLAIIQYLDGINTHFLRT